MKLYQVDAFTAEPFKGNPAGVWIGEEFPADALMQSMAMEMNVSETAFVQIGEHGHAIRYFTPTREVPLCGHATLASAHILREQGIVAEAEPFVLRAGQKELPVSVRDGRVKMAFPADRLVPLEDAGFLEGILGLPVLAALRNESGSANNWILARVADEYSLLQARPDFPAIQKQGIELIAATARAGGPGYDFAVRVFCNPDWGILEDPVTGSANCVLAPYWSAELGKTDLASRQLSQRGGELNIALRGPEVEIMGRARTVFVIEAKVCGRP